MQKVISVTELQRRFRAVFEEVAKQRVFYVFNRGSRPEAVLLRLMARMAERNADRTDEEVAADVGAALAGARR